MNTNLPTVQRVLLVPNTTLVWPGVVEPATYPCAGWTMLEGNALGNHMSTGEGLILEQTPGGL